MPRRLTALVLIGAATVALAGCGGGESKFSADRSRSCFEKQDGLTVSDKSDFVASTALGGAFTVHFPKNQVTLAFGLDRDEARRLTTAYLTFRGRNIGIKDVLRPERNVVMLWKAHPSNSNLDAIEECLK
jgi:hypothetical protein